MASGFRAKGPGHDGCSRGRAMRLQPLATSQRRPRAGSVAGTLFIACATFCTVRAHAGTTDDERPAVGAAADVAGTVVGIDADDIVLDLGTVKGGTDGATVELW